MRLARSGSMSIRFSIAFAQRRDRELGAGGQAIQVDIRVVLAKQPDRDIEALGRQNPERIAGADAVDRGPFDLPLREEFFLEGAMVFDANALEVFGSTIRKVEL